MSLKSLVGRLVPPGQPPLKRLLLLSNFEAERFWADPSDLKLPRLSHPEDTAITNRLEEMSLFLAEAGDVVVLRQPSDPAFLDYLSDLGFGPAEIIGVGAVDTVTPITPLLLDSPDAGEQIRGAASVPGTYLLPYATTHLEEELAARTGATLLGAPARVSVGVNSKIYSRRVVDELGLRAIPGHECESVESLKSAYAALFRRVGPGASIVLKEAMGVSGKGLVVLRSSEAFDRVWSRLALKSSHGAACRFVLEEWVRKSRDINYQIFVAPSGEVKLLGVKEILTTRTGVHLGHRFPPSLTEAQAADYRQAAEAVGRRLHRDGFVGVAGIDSIVDDSGLVYPVLEINARLNMSTYQMTLEPLVGEGCALARYYPLTLRQPLDCRDLLRALRPDLLCRGGERGIVVMSTATANANVSRAARAAKGRLYALLVGRNQEDLAALDQRMSRTLEALDCPVAVMS